jgi:UDP-N-acetylmuramate: L-alanyl-gamma-D-glutamyl-meso-diaminopimelate ligase
LPRNGLIVANGAEASLERVLKRGCWTRVERFNIADGWQAGLADASGAFKVSHGGTPIGETKLNLPGAHNRANAVAALVAARHAGVPIEVGLRAIATFQGVKRRLELRGTVRGVTVYDDFAHHPTAIAATIEGLRSRVGKARILAVLEPRSNTMKLGTMKAQLPGSLADADRVFCYAGNLGWDAGEALAPTGNKATVFDHLDALVEAIAAEARDGDEVLVMSNGGFGGIHGKLLAALAK